MLTTQRRCAHNLERPFPTDVKEQKSGQDYWDGLNIEINFAKYFERVSQELAEMIKWRPCFVHLWTLLKPYKFWQSNGKQALWIGARDL